MRPLARTPSRVAFLKDVIITACEGGINYWGRVVEYYPEGEGRESGGRDTPTWASVLDLDDNDTHTLAYDGGERGVLTIITGQVTRNERMRGNIAAAYVMGEWTGELDVWDADAIVQAGLLWAVVYG